MLIYDNYAINYSHVLNVFKPKFNGAKRHVIYSWRDLGVLMNILEVCAHL